MRYGVVSVAGFGLLLACGGHTSGSQPEPMNQAGSVSQGGSASDPSSQSGGASASGATQAGGAPMVAGSAPVIAGTTAVAEPHDCRNSATFSGCFSGINLTLRLDQRTQDGDTWAEPLQISDSAARDLDPAPALTPLPPPSDWDRALPPAGACVLRVRDWELDCLGRETGIALGDCDDSESDRPEFQSYYQTPWCEAGIAPGCPSPEAWPSDAGGAWWYVVQEPGPSSGGTQQLVICPQLCAWIHQAGSACLHRLPLAI